MAQSKDLQITKNNKQIEIYDLDIDKEIGFSISDEDRAEQLIYLEIQDLICIKAHIDYVLNKAKN